MCQIRTTTFYTKCGCTSVTTSAGLEDCMCKNWTQPYLIPIANSVNIACNTCKPLLHSLTPTQRRAFKALLHRETNLHAIRMKLPAFNGPHIAGTVYEEQAAHYVRDRTLFISPELRIIPSREIPEEKSTCAFCRGTLNLSLVERVLNPDEACTSTCAVIFPCEGNHIYGRECIATALAHSPLCPLCRFHTAITKPARLSWSEWKTLAAFRPPVDFNPEMSKRQILEHMYLDFLVWMLAPIIFAVETFMDVGIEEEESKLIATRYTRFKTKIGAVYELFSFVLWAPCILFFWLATFPDPWTMCFSSDPIEYAAIQHRRVSYCLTTAGVMLSSSAIWIFGWDWLVEYFWNLGPVTFICVKAVHNFVLLIFVHDLGHRINRLRRILAPPAMFWDHPEYAGWAHI